MQSKSYGLHATTHLDGQADAVGDGSALCRHVLRADRLAVAHCHATGSVPRRLGSCAVRCSRVRRCAKEVRVRRGAKTWLLLIATYTAVISYRHSTENERHKGYRVIASCTSTSTKVIAYCRRDSLFQFPESRKMIRFSHRHSGKLVKLIRRPRAAAPCSACIRRRC